MNEQQRLRIVPLDLATANRCVKQWHRHHTPLDTAKFSIGVEDESGRLVGVAICNRPAARMLDDGRTCEVARLATDGTPNACSALYGASKRVAMAMGYERICTYILVTEPGTSLRASVWLPAIRSSGGTWSRPSRFRETPHHAAIGKQRWDCWLVPEAKRRPRVKPVFGESYEGTLLEGVM